MIQAQSLRQIKIRIKSIENTRKITRAMEMVSASKLSKVKLPFFLMKPYLDDLGTMLHDLLSDSPSLKHALLEKRESIKKTTLCVVTSDTGLCGAYNDNVIKCAEQFLNTIKSHDINIITIGKEGFNYFRKKEMGKIRSYPGLYGRYSSKVSDDISESLIGAFTRREADEVYIAYSRFKPSLRHLPVVEKLLNIDPPAGTPRRYIFEPSPQTLLDLMAPKYIEYKLRMILLEAFTSEHSARMLAMKTATDNADDLTGELTLARNKARQFAITKEVLEIAASAEALKG